jgi:hypothetical protein
MYELFDTFMNLLVFAFIGLLAWLYFKKPHTDKKVEDNASPHDQ